MAGPSLRFKRGRQSAFNSVGLQTGEPAFITDDYNFYIGVDGNSATNKYFGSARYWTKETSAAGSGVNLVEGTSNGTDYVTLAAPAAVGAAVTYYFPAANGAVSSVLTNDGSGNLSWASGSSNPVFTGIATFTGAIDANGGADISGGETTLSSATVSDLTAGRVVLAGTSGSLEDSANLTFSGLGLIVGAGGVNITGVSTFSTDLVVGGDIRVNGNDIKDGGGTAAITFDGSGNTTITGNLNINGSTTQVNTTTLTVEDNLIELGKVDGLAPASDLNKDIGILLHYFDDAARLSAVYYDDSVSRVVLASRVGESSGVLTVDAGYYANVELQGLFVTDTAGSGEAVISYTTIGGVTARHLQNITVDGGTF
jgi:hypothetical protein